MSDQALRSKLIRLAHAKPELRPVILPLLKQGTLPSETHPGLRAALYRLSDATEGWYTFLGKSDLGKDGGLDRLSHQALRLKDQIFKYVSSNYPDWD